MIIACPACSTRYVVPDGAIGIEGRTVRCAKCRHSWFQDGPELDPGAGADPADTKPGFTDIAPPPASRTEHEAPATSAPDHPPVEDHPAQDAPEPQSASPSTALPVSPLPASDEQPDPAEIGSPDLSAAPSRALEERTEDPEPFEQASQFDRQPPFRGRRNPLKIWTIAATIFATLAIGTVVAVSYYGLPEWVPVTRSAFGPNQPDLVLDFPAEQQDRRTLPNGTEFFGASGTVTNVGTTTASVPSIMIVMRDQRERAVYSWEVIPPQNRLTPGESLTINEAVTNVPKSAKFAEIGWKAQR